MRNVEGLVPHCFLPLDPSLSLTVRFTPELHADSNYAVIASFLAKVVRPESAAVMLTTLFPHITHHLSQIYFLFSCARQEERLRGDLP